MNPSEVILFAYNMILQYPALGWLGFAMVALGSVTTLASAMVLIIPGKWDDELLQHFQDGKITGKIWVLLRAFSVLKQKTQPLT